MANVLFQRFIIHWFIERRRLQFRIPTYTQLYTIASGVRHVPVQTMQRNNKILVATCNIIVFLFFVWYEGSAIIHSRCPYQAFNDCQLITLANYTASSVDIEVDSYNGRMQNRFVKFSKASNTSWLSSRLHARQMGLYTTMINHPRFLSL